MGVLKNFLCNLIGNGVPPQGAGNNKIVHDRVRHLVIYNSCYDWTPFGASIIFGLAAFNFKYPGYLSKWIRKGRIAPRERKLLLCLILIVCVATVIWTYLTCWMEGVFRAFYPCILFLLPYLSLLLAILLLYYSSYLRMKFDDFLAGCWRLILRIRNMFRSDDYKRTRSGCIYGKWN